MKNKKLILKLIAFIMLISLVGVGYASWNVIKPSDDKNANGSFVIDEVEDFKEYVSINYKSELVYNENGFFKKNIIDSESLEITTVTYNKLSLEITVDNEKCNNAFKTASGIQLKFELIDSTNYDKIVDIFTDKVVVSTSGTGFEVTSIGVNEADKTSKYIIVDVELTEEVKSTTINIDFAFNLEDSDSYFDHISNYNDNEILDVVTSLLAKY